MFQKLYDLWDNYGFEIVLFGCVSFIIIASLYRKIRGIRGSWSDKRTMNTLLGGFKKKIHPSTQISPLSQKFRSEPKKDSKGELECRRVLEYFFRKPFNKARPDFLRNPVTGGNFNLELDCYNSDLRLAVEYNGAQHYKYIPYFHKNKEAFYNQKYRDQMKRHMCKENGVTLIEVPNTVKLEDIKKYMEKELRNHGYI